MALIKTGLEIKRIEAAGRILASVLKDLEREAGEGISLKRLDRLAYELIKERGGTPAFLGYKPYGAEKPYPATLCTSLNEIIVHGLPTDYVLKSGDVIKIDLGVQYQGYHADAALTVGIGNISQRAKKLMAVTKEALRRAIEVADPNHTLGDIGYAVARYVRRHGFSVVEGLTGHGIGKELHEEPSVYNEGKKGAGMRLKEGMTLAIEIMTSAGSPKIIQLEDDSYATSDKSISAHFEHTVIITKDGNRIATPQADFH